MVTRTFDEEKILLEIKQQQKLEMIEATLKAEKESHEMKMERLEKLLEITRAGGVPQEIEKQAETVTKKVDDDDDI